MPSLIIWLALAIFPSGASIGQFESQAECVAAVSNARSQGYMVSDCVEVRFPPIKPAL